MWQVMKMSKVADFLMTNIRTIGLIYVIGAVIVFLVVFLFFKYIEKKEDEEREIARHDDTEEFKKLMQNAVAFVFGLVCAVLWFLILVIIFGLWVHYLITEKIPELTGKFKGDDEREMEE